MDIVCQCFCDQVKNYGIEHVQILSLFRSEGFVGVKQLNWTIREMINPIQDEAIPDLKVGGRFFRENDKVMQTKNNSKASNGDIGLIRKIATDEKNEMRVTISFGNDRIVEYSCEDMANIELAYATTVHKAMGSEYDTVIISLSAVMSLC